MIHSWWMRERLQALLDEELSQVRRDAVAGHLQRCPRCAAAYRQMADGDRLLVAHGPRPSSLTPAAAQALFERALVDARRSRGGPWRGMTMLAWGFAALLVIAASGAAAWWPRLDQGPVTLRTRRAPLARRDIEEDGPTAAHVVADNHRYMSETTDRADSNERPSATARHHGRRHGRASALASAGAPTPVKPRRRPRWSTRLSMATLPTRREEQLLQPGFGEGPGGAGLVAIFALPGIMRPAIREPLADEQACDREAVRLVSAALDGEGSAIREVVAALEERPAAGSDVGSRSTGLMPEVQPSDLMVAEGPLSRQVEPPEARVTEAMLPPPQLLVMVSTAAAPSPVTVTQAPDETPGFARAIACRPDAAGRDTWMQATATTNPNGTRTALVMLGGEVWDW